MTLYAAHQQGVQAALTNFGVKEAGWLTSTRKFIVGEAPEVFNTIRRKGLKEGLGGLFKKDQLLHHGNVFWPTMPGHPVKTWMGRAFGTILPGIGIAQALRGQGDPNEGTLSNVLSTAGQAAGYAYGAPVLGMLGAPFLASAGHRVGKSVGRILGSHPALPPMPPPEQQPQPQMYAPSPDPYDTNPGAYSGGF